jgi:hypothetical protein
LFQAYDREQLRGNDRCLLCATLIDSLLVFVTEQKLELHLSGSIRKITFAVEPRQLALNVRFM